ncbi:hypothetical protein V1264_021128 [Littorina saxatilis]|uniref:WW domain-containing protein n=1 Tax=Littorina saxatilis TaxID=31220 RepID=A0AAN9BBK1_9CAEN
MVLLSPSSAMKTPKTTAGERSTTPQPDYEDSADSGIHGVDGSIPEYDMVGASSCKDCAAGKCHTKFIHLAELPFGWEKVEDPHYGTYFIE